MASYDDSQYLIAQIGRTAPRNPKRALELILQFLRRFPCTDFVSSTYLANFQHDLALAAQIAAVAPQSTIAQLPDSNETCYWKAQRLQKLEFAARTDYWVEFSGAEERFGYLLLNLARKDVKRASALLQTLQADSKYGEVSDLLYRSVICQRENAFKLTKSKYAPEIGAFDALCQRVAAQWFAPQESAVVTDDGLD